MRILIQQKDTGLYLQNNDAWVRNTSEALDFLCSSAAIEFCVTNKLSGVQLVLKFEEEKYDIVMPMVLPDQGPADPSQRLQK